MPRDNNNDFLLTLELLMQSLVFLLVLALATPAFAVGTSHWTHTSEADFKNGTMTNVVATNLGDLKLSRAVKTILEQDPKVSSVYALVEAPDGTVYAGTGPQGVVMRLKDDKVSTACKLDDSTSVFSLALDGDGGLLIGTGGEKGRVLKLDKGSDQPRELFAGEGVQYIWCMVRAADGTIYAGTGPDGQLYAIRPTGGYDLLLDTDENNLLCMSSDGADLLYVGTDPNGLVYRLNRKTKEVYVVHDAPESEISALAMDKKGNLYAATAEATPQAGAGEPGGATDQVGRPEGSGSGAPIPSPSEGDPPKLPDPNPSEPDPIPKKSPADGANPLPPKKLVIIPATTKKTAAKKRGEGDADDAEPQKLPAATSGPTVSPTVSAPPARPSSGEAGKPREGGNAIYKIDKDGMVTEVFRQPVLVLSMITDSDDTLLVGTGSDGLIYQINPSAEETVVLAKVEPKQVMSLLRGSGGRILLGLANTGGIESMTTGYATEGTYTSPVLDASQVSRFGKIRLHGSLPPRTGLKVSTRSGNVSEPSDIGWSKWSDPVAAAEFVPVAAPAARFLQYRFTFTSDDASRSAVIDDVDVAYQEPNLAPDINSIKITTTAKPGAAPPPAAAAAASAGGSSTPAESRFRTIAWEATDPNDDELSYSLFFRTGSQNKWILLKEKLKEATFDWDTRTVGDGRYEIRVVASDELANAKGTGRTTSRVSDPVPVDNTPPIIGNLAASAGAKETRIRADAYDRSSTLANFAYAVDSSDDWQTVLPSDKIADGPEESLDFAIADLKPGPHQIAVRATDARGNQAMQTIAVTVDAPATTRP
ncbi:MAG TPA: PQQ-binding-like beta-propeller repeat protein [Tepidisphaeraceae bacterium]|nr:PQQ-binding-like beta-propeller repeat protein [Tepidisphaeraceae bacterium]